MGGRNTDKRIDRSMQMWFKSFKYRLKGAVVDLRMHGWDEGR